MINTVVFDYHVVLNKGNDTITIYQKDKDIISNISNDIEISSKLFNRLIKNCYYDNNYIDNLFIYLDFAVKHISDYEINIDILQLINKYIILNTYKNLNIWDDIINKKDYNKYLFENRRWPYFTSKSKDWKQHNIEVYNKEYPKEVTNNDDTYIDSDELISRIDNNFASYVILPIKEYNNNYTLILSVLHKLNLRHILLKLFLKLCIHPNTCHIIKEKHITDIISSYSIDNIELTNIINYCIYYAIYILRHEETIVFTKINKKYRIIYNQSQYLSISNIFNIYNNNISNNPLIQQIIPNLYSSIPYYLNCNRYFLSETEQRRRFYIITGGALQDINLNKYKCAITGSILIPTIAYNELEDNSYLSLEDIPNIRHIVDNMNLSESEVKFFLYLETYYPSYGSLLDEDYNLAIKNIDNPKNKTYNIISDIDISVSTLSNKYFDDAASYIYEKVKENVKHINGSVDIHKIYTISSYKYKICGSAILRDIDIFRIGYGAEKMTIQFYLPCVKTWLSGNLDEIYMYNSTVMALLSGVNDRYKWFSCNKIPPDTILKYVQRGYSIILNDDEKKILEYYMESSDRWKYNTNNIFNNITTKHIFFNPCINNLGIRYGLREINNNNLQFDNTTFVSLENDTYTKYDEFLDVKNGVTIFKPNLNKINNAIEYLQSEDII